MTNHEAVLVNSLKDKYINSDNKTCFYDREKVLHRIGKMQYLKKPGYAGILAEMLNEASTPIEDEDVFAGRMMEAVPEPRWRVPNVDVIINPGHLHFRWGDILKLGVGGILEKIERRAGELGDHKSRAFAKNAGIQVAAVDAFARRYAAAAAQKAAQSGVEARQRFTRMARALEVVPMKPAYDLFSALQGIWILHMIASCYAGARDYGFGRIDQYLLPYYEKDLADGVYTREEADALLAFFLMKPNEICGLGSYNHKVKPIPSVASKQYLTLGGCDVKGLSQANALSFAFLRAEEISNMPEPVVVARFDPQADPVFATQVYRTMAVVTDKMHAYNDRLIYNALKRRGLPDEIAADFTFSGCCNVEVHHRTIRNEWYFPTPEWLCEALGVIGEEPVPAFQSMDEILQALKNTARRHMEEQLDMEVVNASTWRIMDQRGHTFDAMFMGECADRCRYPLDGGVDFYLVDVYFTGAATVIDSLSAIDRLVFREKRYSLEEFVQIIKDNYKGLPLLLAELKNKFPKFGNDDEEGDRYAASAMNAVLDVLDEMDWPQGYIPVGGFYSLHHHNNFGWELCATPDGRMAGEPYSENQSPVYGADRKGVTALLSSLAKLPFHRTPCGGVNLTFSSPVTPELLTSIIESYFKMGGLHIAITVADRETLQAALANPEAYRTLTVRLFGFSEYFIHLSEWQQKEFLARTALN